MIYTEFIDQMISVFSLNLKIYFETGKTIPYRKW